MVRRVIIGSIVVGSLFAIPFATHGCGLNVANLGGNCGPTIPIECCQCSWPEDCPPYSEHPPEVPDWCCPYLIAAGCSQPSTYDACDKCQHDGGTDSGDGASSACSGGTCAVLPEGWDPVVLASGAMVVLPECPASAPNQLFEGSSVPGPDPSCPTCSCDPPVGACKPPTTWTVGSSACVGNDVWTNFNPPASWDGSCASNTAITEGTLCGGKPCVGSITISAPVIEEEPCVAHANVLPLDIPKAKADEPYITDGRACSGAKWHSCAVAGEVCVPSPSEPFAACLMHEGDVLCPNGWNSKQVLYGSMDDQRFCTECSCLPSTGATCSMRVQVFGDAACASSELEVNVSLDMGQNCFPIMSGVALAGKSADVLDYKAGACEPSGGELVGDLVLDDARTFCCRTSIM